MSLHNRKRAHSQAFSIASGYFECADCNPHTGRYPPFRPSVPTLPGAYYLGQENMAPHESFITPNPPGPAYLGVYPTQGYHPPYGRAPPIYPSQFNAALAAYARQQYRQYRSAPQTMHKTAPNFVNHNTFGPPGMSGSAAPPVMPVQNLPGPGPYYFPPNDLIGTYMAPQPACETVHRNMNMNPNMNPNMAANQPPPRHIIDQIPPPRMGRLTRSPSQLNFQDLTLRDAQTQPPRTCTPPKAPRQHRTAVGTIPMVVLRE
jgi:hypothetical protein